MVSVYNGQVLVYILKVSLITLRESRWDDGLWVAEICRHHSYCTQAPMWSDTDAGSALVHKPSGGDSDRKWADQIKKGEMMAPGLKQLQHPTSNFLIHQSTESKSAYAQIMIRDYYG